MGRREVNIKGEEPDPSRPTDEVDKSFSELEKFMQELQKRRDEAQANMIANGSEWKPDKYQRKNGKRG